MWSELTQYSDLFSEVKERIRSRQICATLAVNKEMLLLYWEIGRVLVERQSVEGWGSKVLKRLAADIKNELSEVKGFSERNLKLMTQFYREYPKFTAIEPRPVGQLLDYDKGLESFDKIGQQLVAQLPWGHNVLLMQKVPDRESRLWYVEQSIIQGWSRNVLQIMIQNQSHQRQGSAVTNFDECLLPTQSDLAKQALKDPYIFDFLTLDEQFHERELEAGLIKHVEKFLLELGQGFSFVGRQYHLEVAEEDFYIDLLFYHLKLRCFVVIELKKGPFRPEYIGKLNFYLSVVDDKLRSEVDAPTIGLILCQDKNKIIAEYALRDVVKPIGVSEYEIARTLPERLKSSLPTIEEIEAEFEGGGD